MQKPLETAEDAGRSSHLGADWTADGRRSHEFTQSKEDIPSLEETKERTKEHNDTPTDAATRVPSRIPEGSRHVAVMVFAAITQLVQMFPYGTGISSGIPIAAAIYYGLPKVSPDAILPQDMAKINSNAAWIAAAYPLTSGTFVLIGGRFGEIFGHRFIMGLGCAWWVVWTFASGYVDNLIGLCILRAMSGIGGGVLVPNAVAMLGITFPPGKQRNLAMGLFGAMAPVGAAGASLFSAIFAQLTDWRWLMFFGGVLGAVVFSIALIMLEQDEPADPKGKIDWTGSYLGVTGLILFNFCWNQAPAVGWGKVYIYVLLIISIALIVAFCFWESKVAPSPILPFDIWKSKSFGLLLLLAFFSFMSLGIWIWYMTLFGINIRGYTVIENSANYQPLAIGGTCAAFLAAWLVSRIPAQYILAIGNLCLVIISVLLSTTPRHQTYWAMLFPAAVLASFTVDLIFASSQIIASASVGRKRQGVAGSLISTLLTYGLSTGLGFAGTIEAYTNDGGRDLLGGYRHALYFAASLAAFSLITALLFLRVPANKRDGWEDTENQQGSNNNASE